MMNGAQVYTFAIFSSNNIFLNRFDLTVNEKLSTISKELQKQLQTIDQFVYEDHEKQKYDESMDVSVFSNYEDFIVLTANKLEEFHILLNEKKRVIRLSKSNTFNEIKMLLKNHQVIMQENEEFMDNISKVRCNLNMKLDYYPFQIKLLEIVDKNITLKINFDDFNREYRIEMPSQATFEDLYKKLKFQYALKSFESLTFRQSNNQIVQLRSDQPLGTIACTFYKISQTSKNASPLQEIKDQFKNYVNPIKCQEQEVNFSQSGNPLLIQLILQLVLNQIEITLVIEGKIKLEKKLKVLENQKPEQQLEKLKKELFDNNLSGKFMLKGQLLDESKTFKQNNIRNGDQLTLILS